EQTSKTVGREEFLVVVVLVAKHHVSKRCPGKRAAEDVAGLVLVEGLIARAAKAADGAEVVLIRTERRLAGALQERGRKAEKLVLSIALTLVCATEQTNREFGQTAR